VEVIDQDLGLSGTSAAHREGFRYLMSRVCLGEAGAVFGLEISRLGRSNADLARLAEMARLTGTLLIDTDGVYDLSDFNDWLVLGLKSTMSQAELHIMAGRLQAAKRTAAERGELRAPLPVGLAYDDDAIVVTDPDAEVRAAVADVFACFAAAGSAYGVVAAFAGRKFPQRAYGGAWAGQLRWGPLTHHRVLQVLKRACLTLTDPPGGAAVSCVNGEDAVVRVRSFGFGGRGRCHADHRLGNVPQSWRRRSRVTRRLSRILAILVRPPRVFRRAGYSDWLLRLLPVVGLALGQLIQLTSSLIVDGCEPGA